MGSVKGQRPRVKGQEVLQDALTKAQAELLKAVGQAVSERLMQVVTVLLQRLFHQRREGIGLWQKEEQGVCQRCKSHAIRHFMRNGYRPRMLLTPLG